MPNKSKCNWVAIIIALFAGIVLPIIALKDKDVCTIEAKYLYKISKTCRQGRDGELLERNRSYDEAMENSHTSSSPSSSEQPRNLALNKPAYSNKRKRDAIRKPRWAVDGDDKTTWPAGDFPIQWINIQLEKPSSVTEVKLLVVQDPSTSFTHHRVRLLTDAPDPKKPIPPSNDPSVLKECLKKGITKNGEWISCKFSNIEGVTNVQVITDDSESWVAWGEIQVYR